MSKAEGLVRASAWAQALDPAELDLILDCCFERYVPAGGHALRRGEPATEWIGVIGGALKLSVSQPDGRVSTLSSASAGGWIGEAALLQPGAWRYDGIALAATRLACVPRHAFERLVKTSLAFNRYLLSRLQAQMWQSFGLLECGRLRKPEERVAHCIASLFDPELHPQAADDVLRLNQEEIGLLAGVSRQRAHAALHGLQRAGLIRLVFGGVAVLDVEGLRVHRSPDAALASATTDATPVATGRDSCRSAPRQPCWFDGAMP